MLSLGLGGTPTLTSAGDPAANDLSSSRGPGRLMSDAEKAAILEGGPPLFLTVEFPTFKHPIVYYQLVSYASAAIVVDIRARTHHAVNMLYTRVAKQSAAGACSAADRQP